MENRTMPTDAVKLLESLSSADIQHRLDELGAEEAALRTLLRATRARERGAHRPHSESGQAVSR
jgi:hypothetical protein